MGPAVLDATEPSRLGRLELAGGFLRFGTNRGPDLSAGGGGTLVSTFASCRLWWTCSLILPAVDMLLSSSTR